MRNWRMCESANLHFCGSTLFYEDSRICLCAVCVICLWLLIRGFAYLPFALYAVCCGFADSLMRRWRYVPLAADLRIRLCAVCVICRLLRICGFAYAPFALYAFGCGFADLLMRCLCVRLCAIGECANQQICISAYLQICVSAYFISK